MKNTFRYILSAVAMLLPVLVSAQTELDDPPIYDDYNIKGGVGTKKSVGNPDKDGLYTLTLETFATGKTEVMEKSVPADIVLVLDVSGSMDENMPGNTYYYYSSNQSWTPSDIGTDNGGLIPIPSDGNTDYYYKHTDGKYYQVYRQVQSSGFIFVTYTYRYRVTINGNYYYLSGTGLQSSASYVSANTTVYTGPLYTRSRTKMAALKQAVEVFVNEVNHNALYDKEGELRGTPVPHQISVVKFADDSYYGSKESITPGNNRMSSGYNYTQVRIGFTNVSTAAGANSVINAVNDMVEGGATAADYGMTKAWYLMNQPSIKNRESTKVVVMFTDGSPTYSNGFSTTVAGNTIAAAKDLKDDFNATVFTIGVFDQETTQINNYMNWTSSNYPDAEDWDDAGTGSDKGYYQNASDADLTEIFKNIASSASQTDATVEATTQVVDVVSNSFEVPSNFTVKDVQVYTRSVNTAGNDWGAANNLTKIDLTQDPSFDPTVAPPATAEYMTDASKVGVYLKDGKLIILGFNYSKVDSQGADGTTTHPYDGNWVGFRKLNVAAGKELVVEFKIKADPNATGGDGTSTNAANSGIYVLTDDGYVNINSFDVPHKNLPINLVIEKSGLRSGESATIQIYRCHQKKVNGVVQYNETTGKPLPEKEIPAVGVDPNTKGWENFTKVILTNTTGIDGKTVKKTLRALHAEYVYLLVEDNWGWAYDLDDSIFSTDEKEKNPFTFDNTEKTDAVKHAEAISINHFGDDYTEEERVKTYKSSKTQYFSKPTTN